MEKLLKRINEMDQYETWKFVKQNYNLDVVRHFIKMIVLFQEQKEISSFQLFCKKNANGIKTYENSRNARTLLDLGIIQNDDMKVYYPNYKIPKDVIITAFEGDDNELKNVLSKRMLQKNKIFKQKSNKYSSVSIKDETLLLKPYEILMKIMIGLYQKTKKPFITKKEISTFVVAIKSETEVEDVINLILEYRKDNTIITNKINENRFHMTIELIPGIKKQKSIFWFEPAILKKIMGVNINGDIPVTRKKNKLQHIKDSELNFDEEMNYLEGLNMAKQASVKIRNSKIQKYFRDKLLKEFNCKCAFCDVEGEMLTIASHIKGFAECYKDGEIKSFATKYNGLLLCRNHDILFDRNFISINSEGEVVGNFMGLLTQKNISKEKWWNKKRFEFLKYHFNQYFDKK